MSLSIAAGQLMPDFFTSTSTSAMSFPKSSVDACMGATAMGDVGVLLVGKAALLSH